MSTIARRMATAYPDSNQGVGVQLILLKERLVQFIRPVRWFILLCRVCPADRLCERGEPVARQGHKTTRRRLLFARPWVPAVSG